MKKFEIVTGGHVDLPAEFMERWGTHCVALEDHGDYVVLHPAPSGETLPPEAVERWPEEEMPGSVRRGSTGVSY